jgi:hypothetical protein
MRKPVKKLALLINRSITSIQWKLIFSEAALLFEYLDLTSGWLPMQMVIHGPGRISIQYLWTHLNLWGKAIG